MILMPTAVGIVDERVEVGERAQATVDIAVVGDVVAAVGQRGRIERVQPDGIDARGRRDTSSRLRTPSRSPMPSPFESAKLRGYIWYTTAVRHQPAFPDELN